MVPRTDQAGENQANGTGMRVTDSNGDEERPIDSGLEAPSNLRGVSPADAFSVLGNRTRLSILRALWNASSEPVAFAELERLTPVETDNFTYHLEQLVGHFVRRTDDGYVLRYAGETVMRAVIAGLFSESSTLPWSEFESQCPYCGAGIEMRYDDDRLTVRCTSCGGTTGDDAYPPGTFLSYGFPPAGLVGRSASEILEAAHVIYDSKITPMMAGVCPECAGTVGHSFRLCEDHEIDEDGLCDECETRFSVWVEYVCDFCEYQRNSPPWFKLLTEPAIIAFYHEHSDFDRGVPFSKLTWENAPYIRSITQTIVSTDPLRIRVDMPLETAEIRVTVDEDLEILSLQRTAAD